MVTAPLACLTQSHSDWALSPALVDENQTPLHGSSSACLCYLNCYVIALGTAAALHSLGLLSEMRKLLLACLYTQLAILPLQPAASVSKGFTNCRDLIQHRTAESDYGLIY